MPWPPRERNLFARSSFILAIPLPAKNKDDGLSVTDLYMSDDDSPRRPHREERGRMKDSDHGDQQRSREGRKNHDPLAVINLCPSEEVDGQKHER